MMKIPQFDAVIFDMDGVIIDSEDLYTELEQDLFRKVGLNISHDEHLTYQGTSNIMMWTKILQKHKVQLPFDELVEMTNRMVEEHFTSVLAVEPMPGVRKLIDFLLERRVKLALASSSTLKIMELILERCQLKNAFQVVVDSRMAGAGKPNPAVFLMAAQQLGVSPPKYIVIEDSFNGIKGALAAGMFCIAFAGPGSEHQNQSMANWRIGHFDEIIAAIEN